MDNETAAMIMMSGNTSEYESFVKKYSKLKVLDTIVIGEWTLELCDVTREISELLIHTNHMIPVYSYTGVELGAYDTQDMYRRKYSCRLKRGDTLHAVIPVEETGVVSYSDAVVLYSKYPDLNISYKRDFNTDLYDENLVWRPTKDTPNYWQKYMCEQWENSTIHVAENKDARYSSLSYWGKNYCYGAVNFYWKITQKGVYTRNEVDTSGYDDKNPYASFPFPVSLMYQVYCNSISEWQLYINTHNFNIGEIFTYHTSDDYNKLLREFMSDYYLLKEEGEL